MDLIDISLLLTSFALDCSLIVYEKCLCLKSCLISVIIVICNAYWLHQHSSCIVIGGAPDS